MAIDGKYAIEGTMMGRKAEGILTLKVDGNKLLGAYSSMGMSLDISEGTVSGDSFEGVIESKQPTGGTVKMTLTGTVTGDTVKGQMKVLMAKMKYEGVRVSEEEAECKKITTYDEFPEPPGEYTVGRTQMDFDYTSSAGLKRELTAFFFYPSDSNEGKPTAEYTFPELHEMMGAQKHMQAMSMSPDGFFPLDFKTWCYDDVALSDKEGKYPVLFYIHGGTAYPQVGTLICEDLASMGFIVIAIGHQDTGAYKRKDGRLFNVSEEFINTTLGMAQDPEILEYSSQLMSAGRLSEEKAIEMCRNMLALPAYIDLAKDAKPQAEDVRYVTDCLAQMESGELESMFKGRLSLDVGIGVFGHSYGGPSAAMVCRDDDRFVCGIGLDSAAMGVLDDDLGKPFLLLCAESSIINAPRVKLTRNALNFA